MKKMITALLFIISLQTTAAEQLLATITSDVDTGHAKIYLETTSKGHLHSMRFVTKGADGSVYEDFSYPMVHIQHLGAVLMEAESRDVIKLKASSSFSPTTGGVITLDYLYNGVTGKRKSATFLIMKIGNSFMLMTSLGQTVKRLYVVANRSRFVGIIGVGSIKIL